MTWDIDQTYNPLSRRSKTIYRGSVRGIECAIYTYNSAPEYKREVSAWRQVDKDLDLVPKILLSKSLPQSGLLAVEWLEGESYHNVFWTLTESEKVNVVRSCAKILSRIHSVTDKSNQKLAMCFDCDPTQSKSWKEYILDRLDRWLWVVRRAGLDEEGLQTRLNEAINNLVSESTTRHSLLHCDFTLQNIFFLHKGGARAIDFGASTVGDPLYDLCKIGWVDFGGADSHYSKTFISSYENFLQSKVDIRLYQVYSCVQAIAGIAWSISNQAEGSSSFYFKAAKHQMRSSSQWI